LRSSQLACSSQSAFIATTLECSWPCSERPRLTAPGAGPPYAYWPHPWAFGFGFFPFFPLLFIVFFIFILRGLFWRRGWGPRWGYGHGVSPAFEEWHRRAHAREIVIPQEFG
jgi:hypothetical protein